MHINPRSLEIFKFLRTVAGLVVDMKLDRPSKVTCGVMDLHSSPSSSSYLWDDDTENAQARRLAYLGCYYMSAA